MEFLMILISPNLKGILQPHKVSLKRFGKPHQNFFVRVREKLWLSLKYTTSHVDNEMEISFTKFSWHVEKGY